MVIEGYKRRLNDWDDLLAHHAMQVLRPSMKKNARPDYKKFKLLQRKAKTRPEDVGERAERSSAAQERAEAMGPPRMLTNKHGEQVTVTRLS